MAQSAAVINIIHLPSVSNTFSVIAYGILIIAHCIAAKRPVIKPNFGVFFMQVLGVGFVGIFIVLLFILLISPCKNRVLIIAVALCKNDNKLCNQQESKNKFGVFK